MDSMFTIATRFMKKNKKRTIATLLGIILASALVCSIALFLMSFSSMLKTEAEYFAGMHHYAIGTVRPDGSNGITKEQAEKIAANHLVEKHGLYIDDEYAYVARSDGEGIAIHLEQRDKNAIGLKKFEMLEGRLPENDRECIISTGINKNYFMDLKLGGTLQADISKKDLQECDSETEQQKEMEILGERKLTIVGVYEDVMPNIVTIPDNASYHQYQLLVQVKGNDYKENITKVLKDAGLEGIQPSTNNSYMRHLGASDGVEMMVALSTTFTLVSIIIFVAMSMVIRNTFAMSANDKVSEFGLLRCIGATPKQIRSIVYNEALLCFAIAMPLGLLLGVGAMAIVFAIVRNVELSILRYLYIVPSIWPFVVTAVLTFFAVLLSARAPAKLAGKVSPIEAAKGTLKFQETSKKSGRGGFLFGKLFGYPGMLAGRNIRRNRKRFYTTMLSIIVSITLFMTFSGFAEALSATTSGIGKESTPDMVLSYNGKYPQSITEIYSYLKDDSRTEKVFAFDENYLSATYVDTDKISPKYNEMIERFFGKNSFYYASEESMESYKGDLGVLQGKKIFRTQMHIQTIDKTGYLQLTENSNAVPYETLIENKQVLFSSHVSLSSSVQGTQEFALFDYKVGDTIVNIQQFFQEKAIEKPESKKYEEEGEQKEIPLTIGEVTKEVPWFYAYTNEPVGYLFIPKEIIEELMPIPEGYLTEQEFNTGQKRGEKAVLSQSPQNLYIKAVKGQEESLLASVNAQVEKINGGLPSSEIEKGNRIRLANVRESLKELRSLTFVMNIFVYGFLVVIILISSINVYNTISTNISLRKTELAMLRAFGMSKSQLKRMLLLECLLYGLVGTVLGTLVGLPLQWLLINTLSGGFAINFVNPVVYVAISLVAATLISVLSGLGPIRNVVKTPIVEGIRSYD